MRCILVVGGNGQLGRSLRKVSVNYPQLTFVFKAAEELDITSLETLKRVFSERPFDYCINCAAYTDVEGAEHNPESAFAVNAEGVRQLALACKDNRVKLIHPSTDYVFDGKKNAPYLTDDLPNPINVYGKSKLKGEQYIADILTEFFIVRTSWLYSEFGKNFYKAILKKANEGEDLFVTDEQKGCPTNARNLATYVVDLILAGNEMYGIYHFTDGEAMTWYDFAERILKENGLEDSVRLERVKNYRTFAQRPKYSVLG